MAFAVRCALLLLCGVLPVARAAEFHDPTRPAPAFLPGAASAPAAQAEDVFALEAVQRTAKRATAIIAGKRVAIGDKVGAWQLESLGADSAVLVGPGGRRVLRVADKVKRAGAMTPPALEGERKK